MLSIHKIFIPSKIILSEVPSRGNRCTLMAMKLLVLFELTYICNQIFSTLNINKNMLFSKLINFSVQLQFLLSFSTFDMQPDFKWFNDSINRSYVSSTYIIFSIFLVNCILYGYVSNIHEGTFSA